MNNDLISRQTVLKKVSTWTYDMYDYEDLLKALKEIRELPPAQPEITEEAIKEYCRKRGLTIITNDFFHELATALPIIKSIKGV